MKKITYKIEGMHCASCELIIEKKLIQLPEIESVEASTKKGQVTIYCPEKEPSRDVVEKLLSEDGYCFCDECDKPSSTFSKEILTSAGIAISIFLIFILFNRLGLTSLVNVSQTSSLPAFFFFGLLAGVSTCAALTGGIVLSMSNTWQKNYSPHLLFNIGRILAYTLLGAVLGAIGSKLQLSLNFNAILVIAVSIFMILTGLKMFGVKALRGFQIALPKALTRKASNHNNVQGRFTPAIIGALTVLLPCGFTITTESLALLSGNFIQGALIMAAFAIGTAPGLLAIGYSSVKMGNSSKALMFSKVAGALVLLFAVFNINSQLNILGLPSFSNLNVKAASETSVEGLAPIVSGKQLLQMNANANGYTPNYFKVKAGTPVRWEITDTGTSGCTNAVMSNSLFQGQIPLTPGQVSVKEFTPTKTGKYKFSCWMGMVTGTIEVVSAEGSSAQTNAPVVEIPSGAKGCGCGGGGATSCGGTR